MPKRMIDTELWNDENIISEFTAEDRYFWLYLLTNPHNKMCGVLKFSPALMARDMGLHKDTIVNLIYRFERIHQLIVCDKETNEIFICNWYKYNWTKSPKIVSIIEKEKSEIKSNWIVDLIEDRLSCFLEKKEAEPIGYRYPSNSNTITNTNTVYYPILENINFSAKVKDSITKWLNYKKEKKQSYKEIGLDALLKKLYKQCEEFGDQYVIDSIEYSISNNWSGIFPPKTDKPTSESKTRVRHGNFDIDDSFAKALERSYNND